MRVLGNSAYSIRLSNWLSFCRLVTWLCRAPRPQSCFLRLRNLIPGLFLFNDIALRHRTFHTPEKTLYYTKRRIYAFRINALWRFPDNLGMGSSARALKIGLFCQAYNFLFWLDSSGHEKICGVALWFCKIKVIICVYTEGPKPNVQRRR